MVARYPVSSRLVGGGLVVGFGAFEGPTGLWEEDGVRYGVRCMNRCGIVVEVVSFEVAL